MRDEETDIMTLSDTAAYLKLAEKTVLRLVHRRELPSFKVASQWRFRKGVIDEWIMTKIQHIPTSDLSKMIESGKGSVPLKRIIQKDLIRLDIKPDEKKEVLRQLIEPLALKGVVYDEETLLEKLMGREEMASTAISRGVALPHIRHPRENPPGGPYVVIGVCPEGTEFDSYDGKPTHVFFLICTPTETVHLRIMAKVSLLLRQPNVIEKIASAGTPNEIIDLLADEENSATRRAGFSE
jgi:excisionase family DNA binding protein